MIDNIKRKNIMINKQGYDHDFYEKNNQDFLVFDENIKIVIDGCGSLEFSEVGVRLFAQFIRDYIEVITVDNFKSIINQVFERLIDINFNDEFLYNNFSFTILACIENEEEFVVFSCGDGYIITKNQDKIEFIELDDGEYPKYYIYNYIVEKEEMIKYNEGVDFTINRFSKEEFENVGVATDGLRFYEDLNILEKNKMIDYLEKGRNAQIGMIINRNKKTFKDDITICF